MEPTYQQILAEVYDENAKNLLVHQTEYDDEDQPPYEKFDYSDNELEDKEEFNKFHGDRGKPEHVIQPEKRLDGLGLASIKKDTIFRTNVINIDAHFRGNNKPMIVSNTNCAGNAAQTPITAVQLPGNFSFRTAREYKNVYSVEVTSIEFPNNFYTFSTARGNTTFNVIYPYTGTSADATNTYPITILNGNYTNIVNPVTGTPFLPTTPPNTQLDATTLLGAIQVAINNVGPLMTVAKLTINYSSTLHICYFNLILGNTTPFLIQFPLTNTNAFKNGIGYNLGFVQNNIVSSTTQTAEPIAFVSSYAVADTYPDTIQDNYIYLKISDWNLISHETLNQTNFTAFMKIPLTVPKFTTQFDNNSLNTTNKQYFFHQPTNINVLTISLLDAYGNIIDMKYGGFSLTLQIQECLSNATYEALLENK